jgi:putative hydrolase of the HAD superfamily
MQKPIRAVLFDYDDTLWECHPVLRKAGDAQQEFIQTNYPRIAAKYSTDSLRTLLHETRESEEGALEWSFTRLRKHVLRRVAQEEGYDAEEVAERVTDAFLEARCDVKDHIFPGVLEALSTLKQHGYYLAAITNGNAELARISSLTTHLEWDVNPDKAGCFKPDKGIFDLAWDKLTQQLEGLEKEEVLYVGDNYEGDVVGACEYGWQAVWITNDATHQAFRESNGAPSGQGVLRSVSELPALLRTNDAPSSTMR